MKTKIIPFHEFKSIDEFQKFLRAKYPQCHKRIGCLDYVKVGGVLYTMHEFDERGRVVNWANLKRRIMIECETANRYALGYKDAEVFQYSEAWLRNDINYAE